MVSAKGCCAVDAKRRLTVCLSVSVSVCVCLCLCRFSTPHTSMYTGVKQVCHFSFVACGGAGWCVRGMKKKIIPDEERIFIPEGWKICSSLGLIKNLFILGWIKSLFIPLAHHYTHFFCYTHKQHTHTRQHTHTPLSHTRRPLMKMKSRCVRVCEWGGGVVFCVCV